MEKQSPGDWLPIAGIGALCGMRVLLAPGLLCNYLAQHRLRAYFHPCLRFLTRPQTCSTLTTAAMVEVAGDKIPGVPPRTWWPELAGRIASGLVAGAAMGASKRMPWMATGALAGAAAAASAYATQAARRRVGQTLHVPDVVVGFAEDALVCTSAHYLLRRYFGWR